MARVYSGPRGFVRSPTVVISQSRPSVCHAASLSPATTSSFARFATSNAQHLRRCSSKAENLPTKCHETFLSSAHALPPRDIGESGIVNFRILLLFRSISDFHLAGSDAR